MMRKLGVYGIMAAIVIAILLGGMSHGMTSTRGDVRATVVIQFGNGDMMSAIVELPQSNTTALKATELACQNLSIGFHYTWYSGMGALVDRIGWEQNQWPGAYWHFMVWKNNSNDWKMSNSGASSVNLNDGDIIAWIYTVDNSSYAPLNYLSSVPGHYTSWTSYRGDLNNTAYVKYNVSGTDIIWKFRGMSQWGFSSTPAVYRGMIFIADDKALYALSSSGEELWNNSMGQTYVSSPTVYKDMVYIGNKTGYLNAFYINNGTLAWGYKISNSAISSSPKVDIVNGTPAVIIGTEEYGAPWGKLFVFNALTGEEIWNITLNSSVHFSVPAISDGKIIVPLAGRYNSSSWSYDPPHELVCVNETDGKIIWNVTLSATPKYSPSIYESEVYVPYGNYISAIDLNTGQFLWNLTLNGTTTSPAVVNGKIYVGTGIDGNQGEVYEIENGSIAWNTTLNGAVNGVVATDSGLILTTNSPNGTFYRISYGGEIMENFTPSPSNYMLSLPVISDSAILVASNDGYIFAIGNKSSMPEIPLQSVTNPYVGKSIKIEFQSQEEYQAILYYKNSSMSEFRGIKMNYESGEYVGYIPPQNETTTIQYYITLVSPSGDSNSTTVQVVQVIQEVPEFQSMIAPVIIVGIALLMRRKL